MDQFLSPPKQSTLTQNVFSTDKGVTRYKTTLDIESYAIKSMHESLMNGHATVSRGSADKRVPTEYDLSELTTDIPDEYVEAINSGSDPDFVSRKHNPDIRKRSTPDSHSP